MAALSEQRCLNHGEREAVARCPECRRYFCRECIVEHEDRVVCSSCLRKLVAHESPRSRRLLAAWRLLQCAGSILLLWIFFFLLGRMLMVLPSATHSDALWKMGYELPEEE